MCAPRATSTEARAHSADALDTRAAREALARARSLASSGRLTEAVLALRVVERALPELADRVALEEAEYRMQAGADALACQAFERAMQSPHRTVAARAEIRRVYCLLAIADRRGVRALDELRRAYPEMPHDEALSLSLAQAHERWSERETAVRLYREIDLRSPGSAQASAARQALERLRSEGVVVREPTLAQQVERAERLTSGGYYDAARPELERLRSMELPRPLAQQLARSAARIARVEGRWADAQALLREAQGLPTLTPEESAAMDQQAADLARAAAERDQESVRREVRALLRGRAITRQPTARLLSVLQSAARAGVRDVADDVVRELVRRSGVPPVARFEAGILAAGTADDALVAELFAALRTQPRVGVAARYHHARALERLGRADEARAEYARVVAEDDRGLPYYALWARTRLGALAPQRAASAEPRVDGLVATSCTDVGPFTAVPEDLAGKAGEPNGEPVTPRLPAPAPTAEPVAVPALHEPPPPAFQLAPDEMVRLLRPVADEHGEAYPWLPRAVALIELGELSAADDELQEAFVAWRDARGGGSLRSGLVAVLRGAAPPRLRVAASTWRDRRRLSNDARVRLARVAAALGDHGLAIRFHGFSISGQRPRAYEHLVEQAAARHGVDPELLFAVMRVESVYNPQIISYAGAIGLMQIMPRTGRLIARSLGREDFTVDQLLEPEVNVEFAAWYLASLIRRFDGRLPLAIASYNGGPHNVRRWMRDHAESMPLDAFLERIPFDQTHRYVRRVLTHYAAYRAQRGRPVPSLHVALPNAAPDPLAF
jgi:soluble lytic murein transglycosylase